MQDKKEKCPICNSSAVFREGCWECIACGWSSCKEG